MENNRNKTLWNKVLRIWSEIGKLVISLVMSLFMYRIIGGTWGIVLGMLFFFSSLFRFLSELFKPRSDNDQKEHLIEKDFLMSTGLILGAILGLLEHNFGYNSYIEFVKRILGCI